MKLELKHLAPYLPYKLRVDLSALEHFNLDNKCDIIVYIDEFMYGYTKNKKVGFSSFRYSFVNFNTCKPILRPLSDLHKLIDWNKDGELTSIGHLHGIEKVNEDGDEFYAEQFYVEYTQNPSYNLDIRYFNWWLFEHHFDVFGLIEQDLAIDINTLK